MQGRPTAGSFAGGAVRALLAVVAAVVGIVLAAGAALADPVAPGGGPVDTARVQALTAQVSDLARQQAAAQTAVATAQALAAIALDDYRTRQQAYAGAQEQASAAQTAEAAAADDLRVAQDRLAGFARSSYIDGSTSPGAASLLTADDPAELVRRAVLLGISGGDRSVVLKRFTGLRQLAAEADAAAKAALARAQTLQQQAAGAFAAAQTAERAGRAQQAQLTVRMAGLLTAMQERQTALAGLVGPEAAAAIVNQQRTAAAGRTGGTPLSVGMLVGNKAMAGAGSARVARTAITAAASVLGTPYAWGGGGAAGPGPGIDLDAGVVGFDCSGLTQYAYAKAGVAIPRNAGAQYEALPKVARADLQPGDLVFWAQNPADPRTIHHVALYVGGAQVVQAPESGDVVKASPMWWDGYAGAVRPSA
jgi:cell wall-associated NlpC family hydrolase